MHATTVLLCIVSWRTENERSIGDTPAPARIPPTPQKLARLLGSVSQVLTARRFRNQASSARFVWVRGDEFQVSLGGGCYNGQRGYFA